MIKTITDFLQSKWVQAIFVGLLAGIPAAASAAGYHVPVLVTQGLQLGASGVLTHAIASYLDEIKTL